MLSPRPVLAARQSCYLHQDSDSSATSKETATQTRPPGEVEPFRAPDLEAFPCPATWRRHERLHSIQPLGARFTLMAGAAPSWCHSPESHMKNSVLLAEVPALLPLT